MTDKNARAAHAPASTNDARAAHAPASAENELIRTNIEGYLERYQNKELLRFVAVGSVDDGKSTLIGRLLHDTGSIPEDQLVAMRRASKGGALDLSLATDGLTAEREQGITIDVAYRYFATEKRKFIIADTPGHIQYTRNMVTGASTANVAIILIDARYGVLEQSRRHGFIGSLLGIPHLAVCVNKMDLVGYDPQVFARIGEDFRAFAKSLGAESAGGDELGYKDIAFFPVSALEGVNVVRRGGAETPWYDGPTLLEYLERVPVSADRNLESFRFPVQYVVRPNLDYRGFAGEVVSGVVKKDDPIVVLPSGKKSRVRSIDTFDGPLEEAFTPQSVVLRLEDEIDISRGDMLVRAEDLPEVDRRFDAFVVWMHEKPLDPQKSYLLKHTTQHVRAQLEHVHFKKDMKTLEDVAAPALELNDVAKVRIACHKPIYFDPYVQNRSTGSFILIDSLTNATVAAGMIVGDERAKKDLDAALKELRAGSGLAAKTQVSPAERKERMGQKGATVWLTGLPGSGRWPLAYALERRLFDLSRAATVIDPTDEDLRSMISAAKACTDAGLVTICAFPSAAQTTRETLRARIGKERVAMIYVNTAEALCRERRPDADFSGFEPPLHPDLTLALDKTSIDEAVETIIALLEKRGELAEE
jgi:bifunctional enzyme CysN/CysC